jgi:DNA-binding CsgD family transcriptional regulator/pimeloyl-ACP methyl ester carboxylesterase
MAPAMNTPAAQYVTAADGFSIAYTVEGAGRPAIMMPQSWFQHLIAGRNVPGLRDGISWISARFELIRFDRRGQGMSGRGLLATHTWRDYQLDLEAVADRAAREPFALFAGVEAAATAIPYVVAHPERVSALILLNPAVWKQAGERYLADVAEYAARDWEYFVTRTAQGLAGYLGFNASGTDLGAAKEVVRTVTTQADFLAYCRSFGEQSVESSLPAVRVPTLIMATRSDRNADATEATSRRLAAAIPGARLTVFDNNFDPGRFAVMDDFLSGVYPRERVPESGSLPLTTLSPREREILRLVAAGLTNREIAEELVISVRTVARHVTNLYIKIGVRSKAEATAYAIRRGIT